MDCDARKNLIMDYALGVLEGAEQEELLAHLQGGCPICLGRLAEAQAIFAMLPTSLERVQPPASARQKVLANLKADSANNNDSHANFSLIQRQEKPLKRYRWFIPATLGGAVAASGAVLIFLNILTLERKSFDKLESRLHDREGEIVQLRTDAQVGQELKRLVNSPDARVLTLRGSAVQPGARGQLIWNPANRTFHFSADNLRNLPPGKAYELWLINSENKKIAAGICVLNGRGGTEVVSALQADPGVIVASAVTDEPKIGVSAPTGAIQLIGKVN